MDCVFCDIVAGRTPAHIVYEDGDTLAFLDIAPIQRGHTLVVPKKHAADIFEIEPDQAAAVMRSAQKVARAVKAAFHSDGVRLFQNNGAAAGQTHFHFHVHVVPRWVGDGAGDRHGSHAARDRELERAAEQIRRAMGPGG